MPDKPTPQPRIPSSYEAFEQLRVTMSRFRSVVLDTLNKTKQRQETAIAVSNSKLHDLEQKIEAQRRWMLVVWAIALLDLGLHVWGR